MCSTARRRFGGRFGRDDYRLDDGCHREGRPFVDESDISGRCFVDRRFLDSRVRDRRRGSSEHRFVGEQRRPERCDRLGIFRRLVIRRVQARRWRKLEPGLGGRHVDAGGERALSGVQDNAVASSTAGASICSIRPLVAES